MTQERIRILIDRSRDSGWSDALVYIEPDTLYQVTDNKDCLRWTILKNYDVLTISGYSPLEYKDEELDLIRRFVEAGGGLLLAFNSGRFERDVGELTAMTRVNKVARIFGAEFLPLARCKSERKFDENLQCGYPRQNLRLLYHTCLADLELDDIPISNCGIIAIPEDAQVFLEHSETKEPIGACMKFEKGRILLINDLSFSQGSQRTCKAFLDWLGNNRMSKMEGDETIPDEIPVDEYVKEDGRIRIYYTDFVKDKVDICLEFAKKIEKNIIDAFPESSDIAWDIELNSSCICRYSWRDSVLCTGVFMNNAQLAYALGVGMTNLLNMGGMELLIRYAVGSYDAVTKCFGMMAMKLLGFQREAEEMYAGFVRRFEEKDPTGKGFDISKAYEYHPKSVWILSSLMEKYGHDLLVRLTKAIPDYKDPWKNMPRSLFSPTDIFIHYLSRALEVNLYPWFQEFGTTVHLLPLHPSDGDEFKKGVLQCLKDTISDECASAGDRSDAIWCLIDMYDNEKKPMAQSAAELDSADKYNRLVAAIRLSRISDSRSIRTLEELASNEDDRSLAAIAALTLVRAGIALATDRLIQTASGQDCRFQLDVGYALQKIGHEEKMFHFTELKDENGVPVVKMEVEYDDYLKLFPTVAGYKVANINSAPGDRLGMSHFSENTHITLIYVTWVYTSPLYRRKGLSRWAMQETIAHKIARQCSCACLGTGTRNTAHAMYRSFGFVDIFTSEVFTKELREEKAKVLDGVFVRSYSPGDEVKMAALADECYSDMLMLAFWRDKTRRQPPYNHIKIVEKAGEMLGYVRAVRSGSKEEAWIADICVKNADDQDDIGAILLCALHNDLASRGFKKISIGHGTLLDKKKLRKLFYSFGYSSQQTSGVFMFKITNLPMLLMELSPLLAKRLKDSDYKDWRGKIGVIGQQHKAGIIIEDGQVCAIDAVPEGADILISANDDVITRIIAGRITPFEAYLQMELRIQPVVNDQLTGLLETLFPHIPKDRER